MIDYLMLHVLMAAHTIIVLASFAAGPFIAWNAIRGERPPLFWLALGFPPLICIGRLLNGEECILQSWARELRGINTGWARDIYLLPEAWALQVVLIGGILYVSGVIIFLTQRSKKQ